MLASTLHANIYNIIKGVTAIVAFNNIVEARFFWRWRETKYAFMQADMAVVEAFASVCSDIAELNEDSLR